LTYGNQASEMLDRLEDTFDERADIIKGLEAQ
jgi:hypothetical protein